MRPFQVLAALLVVATVLVAAVLALRARRADRDLADDDHDDVDAPLRRLRGFHIFGPDGDEDDHRRIHIPVLQHERPKAPPSPLAPKPQPQPQAVTRTFLPPTPPPPASNGNGHVTLTGTVAKPRPAPQRPDIDDQLGRDILLVEDDDTIATMYQMLLDSRGYSTRHARDGVEGIAAVRKERPALILLDMLMPRMDGLQFLEALRGWPKTASIPVVILSNVADHSLVERALALGAVEYLIKAQTRPQVLIGALPHWLRGNRALSLEAH